MDPFAALEHVKAVAFLVLTLDAAVDRDLALARTRDIKKFHTVPPRGIFS
jgi:hypothetical protein